MALSIKSSKADRLARDLCALTGESITDAVVVALEERLATERRRRRGRGISDVVERFSALAVVDERTPNEVLGYDGHGLPQ